MNAQEELTVGEMNVDRDGYERPVAFELHWRREESDAPWECVHVKAFYTDRRPYPAAELTDSELWQAKEKFCP